MSALMTDVIEGTVTPVVANAAVNAGGKLLKAVELQLKYGSPEGADGSKTLMLCNDREPDEQPASEGDEQVARKKKKLELLEQLARLEAEE